MSAGSSITSGCRSIGADRFPSVYAHWAYPNLGEALVKVPSWFRHEGPFRVGSRGSIRIPRTVEINPKLAGNWRVTNPAGDRASTRSGAYRPPETGAARKEQDRIVSASVGLVAAMAGSSSLFTIRTASEAPRRSI
jgi:hypothetical protein